MVGKNTDFSDIVQFRQKQRDFLHLIAVIIGNVGNANFNAFTYGIQIKKIFKNRLIRLSRALNMYALVVFTILPQTYHE